MGFLSRFNPFSSQNTPIRNNGSFDWYYSKNGAGTQMAQAADKLGYEKLKEYLGRTPGYTTEEQQAMYDVPAQQTKFDETASLRRLNQEGAATGSYRSGARVAGAGRILAESSRTRAGLRQNVKIQAANAALADRQNQLQAMEGYVLPRLGLRQNAINQYNEWYMNRNNLSWQQRQWAADQLLRLTQSGTRAAACWIAEALWGDADTRTIAARFYFTLMAPKWLYGLYRIVGPTVAAGIRLFPPLGWPFRPFFRLAANKGAARIAQLL